MFDDIDDLSPEWAERLDGLFGQDGYVPLEEVASEFDYLDWLEKREAACPR